MTTPKERQLPTANLRPEPQFSWAWLIPLGAAAFAGWLGYQTWSLRAFVVTVQFEEGHGLAAGDELRYRGIPVGHVRSIVPADELDGVVADIALEASAARLACAGARIWIVRPQLNMTGASGLETLVGPRYLAILPGNGAPQRRFVGLPQPPAVDSIDPGDLEILLTAPQRYGVRPGAPVLYRHVPVGTVVSVGLSSDAGAVESRVHIEKEYVQLIRPETRFWSAGGFEATVGIRGMSIQMETLDTLLAGGVALATPPHTSDVVRTGHRFPLHAKPEPDWLAWQPMVAIGSALLPPGATMPTPLRAVRVGRSEGWFTRERSRRGWVLPTARGLLGPSDLLQVAEAAADDKKEGSNRDPDEHEEGGPDRGSAGSVLEIAGKAVPPAAQTAWANGPLVLIERRMGKPIPMEALREAVLPEDCLIVGDPNAPPIPLASSKLLAEDGVWTIAPSITIDESWHGAVVVARADGLVVGMIVRTDNRARVALLKGLP